MPGHSRSKNGVASLAYVPSINVLVRKGKSWMTGTSPAMTTGWKCFTHSCGSNPR
jgi:hypothetical protein